LLHAIAFLISLPAGLAVIAAAQDPRTRMGVSIYALSLALQFGSSAAYHLGGWAEPAYARMRRLDHASIFVLIAGSYTPLCLVALHGAASATMLACVWGGAAIGVATKMYRVDLHVVSGIMYVGLGWASLLIVPALARELSPTELTLTVVGGIIYTTGAVTLATHRPDPFPRIFGYHEVWHVATIVAAACVYGSILLAVLGDSAAP
jgi:hemolysin III